MERLPILFLGAAALLQVIFFTGPAVTGASPLVFVAQTAAIVAVLPLFPRFEALWERRSRARQQRRRKRS